jgi:hypothetical protein
MDLIRTGYLWKLNDNKKTWDKYWFSLNNSSLLYWNEKIEQDLSKQPLSKIELFKCVQIKELFNINNLNNDYENYSFQLNFHNNYGSIIFKAIANDVCNNWIQALKQSIDQSVSNETESA